MRIAFHTLGCKVNQYETEALQGLFVQQGHHIVGEQETADAYIVNTCTVTNLADRKSRQWIRRMKTRNPEALVAVTGCYVQMQPEAASAMYGVDIVVGNNLKSTLPQLLEEARATVRKPLTHHMDLHEMSSFEELAYVPGSGTRTRMHLKIQDGCNRFCSYCIVPYARGGIRSRTIESIAEEAKRILADGCKEIVLTGINTALYGQDFENPTDLWKLLTVLDQLPGDFRIRLSSLEPTVIRMDSLYNIWHYNKLCPHLHLSLQSGSQRILEAMNRNYSPESFLTMISHLKTMDPGFSVTTDIIVGFPGETELDFAHSMDVVSKAHFAKVHVFKYSKRQGTPAADMPDQVSETVKTQRSRQLMAHGEATAKIFFAVNIGLTRRVLLESYLENLGMAVGYTENYIRTYLPMSPEEAKEQMNRFVPVVMKTLYRDGMEGKCI